MARAVRKGSRHLRGRVLLRSGRLTAPTRFRTPDFRPVCFVSELIVSALERGGPSPLVRFPARNQGRPF